MYFHKSEKFWSWKIWKVLSLSQLSERNWNVLKIPEMFVNIKFMLKWRNELTQQIFMNWHKEFTLFSFCIFKNNFCWFVWFLNIRMGCNFVGFHFNAVHFLVVYPHWVSLWCIKMQIETFVSFIVLCSHTRQTVWQYEWTHKRNRNDDKDIRSCGKRCDKSADEKF